MANLNAPHGLRPLMRTVDGGEVTIRELEKVVGYATAIFQHDAVNQVADGSIEASATPGTTRYSGVALNFGAASKATRHSVIVSPTAVYEAQGDGSGSLDQVDRGLNANLVLTAGNATTKQSKHQIGESTKAVTATLDVKLIDFLNVPDNDYGANARFEIRFNKHRQNPEVAGV